MTSPELRFAESLAALHGLSAGLLFGEPLERLIPDLALVTHQDVVDLLPSGIRDDFLHLDQYA